MLELGASKPWPEALYVLTGQRQMDASALIEYFQPLQAWLKEQNRGQKCGW
jgi:peptidyl-dipeptidase A